MIALGRQAEKEGRPGARLLIVTGQPDRNLQQQVRELAATRGVKSDWLLYQAVGGSERRRNGPRTAVTVPNSARLEYGAMSCDVQLLSAIVTTTTAVALLNLLH